MRCLVMFITAVCLLFLLKIRFTCRVSLALKSQFYSEHLALITNQMAPFPCEVILFIICYLFNN